MSGLIVPVPTEAWSASSSITRTLRFFSFSRIVSVPSHFLILRNTAGFFFTIIRPVELFGCKADSALNGGCLKSDCSFVRGSHFSVFSSVNSVESRACVCFRSELWMPERTMTRLYPRSAAFAATAVKFVVFPDWTYPTTRPRHLKSGRFGRGVCATTTFEASSTFLIWGSGRSIDL